MQKMHAQMLAINFTIEIEQVHFQHRLPCSCTVGRTPRLATPCNEPETTNVALMIAPLTSTANMPDKRRAVMLQLDIGGGKADLLAELSPLTTRPLIL